MMCLVSCLIWASGKGYWDSCPKEVKLVHETQQNFYVELLDATTERKGSIRIEYELNVQKVEKSNCSRSRIKK